MLTVQVITPERSLPPLQAIHVTFAAVDGEVGVRTGHAPLVAQLAVGFAMIRDPAGKETLLAIKGGTALVRNDEVQLFTESVIDAEHIDLDKVAKALDILGSTPPTNPVEAKRNELEATWNLLQSSLAGRRAGR
jgi:F0F1-type ATP synthase epsilon subunit